MDSTLLGTKMSLLKDIGRGPKIRPLERVLYKDSYNLHFQEVTGYIHDSCPSCARDHWDLSTSLYLELTGEKELGEQLSMLSEIFVSNDAF